MRLVIDGCGLGEFPTVSMLELVLPAPLESRQSQAASIFLAGVHDTYQLDYRSSCGLQSMQKGRCRAVALHTHLYCHVSQ